jgi:hypothetical protein
LFAAGEYGISRMLRKPRRPITKHKRKRSYWLTFESLERREVPAALNGITEYSVTTGSSDPYGMTSGPDGLLWFVERAGNKIGKITTSGTITEYSIPTGSSNPFDIVSGPDGLLWGDQQDREGDHERQLYRILVQQRLVAKRPLCGP